MIQSPEQPNPQLDCFGTPLSLPFSQRILLSIPIGNLIVMAKDKAMRFFFAEMERLGYSNPEQLLDVIKRAGHESTTVVAEILRGNDIVQKVFTDDSSAIEAFIQYQIESRRIGTMLFLILQNSPQLSFPYIGKRDRDSLTFDEIEDIAQRAAVDIARKLEIDERYTAGIKDSLIPGIVDPSRLASY